MNGDSKDDLVYWERLPDSDYLQVKFLLADRPSNWIGPFGTPYGVNHAQPYEGLGLAPAPFFRVFHGGESNRDGVLFHAVNTDTQYSRWDLTYLNSSNYLVTERATVLGCNDYRGYWRVGPTVLDFNGDGANDIFGGCASNDDPPDLAWQGSLFDYRDFKSGIVHPYTAETVSTDPLFSRQLALDVDGDRKEEIVSTISPELDGQGLPIQPPGGLVGVLSGGQSGTDPSDLPAVHLNINEDFALADVNGDGLKDAVSTASDTLILRMNTGRGFGPPFDAVPMGLPDQWRYADVVAHNIRAADFDRDGREDLLVPLAGSGPPMIILHRSLGESFEPIVLPNAGDPLADQTQAFFLFNHVQVLDSNADGNLEFTQIVDGQIRVVEPSVDVPVATLASVDDGVSNPAFFYDDVYTQKETVESCNYPQVCQNDGRWIAWKLERDLPDGSRQVQQHRHVDARYDARSNVDLGFHRVVVSSWGSERYSRVEHEFDRSGVERLPQPEATIAELRYPFALEPATSTQHRFPDPGPNITFPDTDHVISSRTDWSRALQWIDPTSTAARILVEQENFMIFEKTDWDNKTPHDPDDAIHSFKTEFSYDSWGTQTAVTSHDLIGGNALSVTDTISNRVEEYQIGLIDHRTTVSTTGSQSFRIRTEERQYDAAGRLERVVYQPLEPKERLTIDIDFDTYGNPIGTESYGSDGVARTTSSTYDAVEHTFIVSQRNSLGHESVYKHDPGTGARLGVIDPNGDSVAIWIDGFSKVVRREYQGLADTYTFDPGSSGKFELEMHVAGYAPTTQIYDRFGQVIREEQFGSDGRLIHRDYEYGEGGELVSHSLPHFDDEPAHVVETTYDGMGRRVEVELPTGATQTWEYFPRLVHHVNERGGEYRTHFDGLGRPDWDEQPSEGGSRSRLTRTYGPFGVLSSYQDSQGNTTSFVYDDRGRRTQIDDPDSGVRQFVYNAFGEVVETSDLLSDREFAYDLLGRLTSVNNYDGQPVSMQYDTAPNGIGRLHWARRDGAIPVESEYSYDSHGRQSDFWYRIDSDEFHVETQYANGRISRSTYQAPYVLDLLKVDYAYDFVGQLEKVSSDQGTLWTVLHRSDPFQRATKEARGPMTIERGFGTLNPQLVDYSAKVGSTQIEHRHYDYYADGRLYHDDDLLTGKSSEYLYDSRNRLISSELGSFQEDFGYDAIGNQIIGPNGTRTFGTGGRGPHALAMADGVTYAYDDIGRRESDSRGWQATYTAFDLPSSIVDASGAVTEYGYDAFNRRAYEVRGSTSTYRMGDTIRQERAGGIDVQTTFNIEADGEVVAELRYDRVSKTWSSEFPTQDRVGTTLSRADGAGKRIGGVWRNPFGASDKPPLPGDLFAGHELETSGLIDAGGRLYDPTNAVFITPDPIVQWGHQLNPYSYAEWDPLNRTDPSGFNSEPLPEGPPVQPPAQLLELSGPGDLQPLPWNPPGRQPARFYIGNWAHRYIGRAYELANPTHQVFTNDRKIVGILRRLGFNEDVIALAAGNLARRPDIFDATLLQVFEIKPARPNATTAAGTARTQAQLYISIFALVGLSVDLGSPAAPGTTGTAAAPLGVIYWWSPAPGVILYEYMELIAEDVLEAAATLDLTDSDVDFEDADWWNMLPQHLGLVPAAQGVRVPGWSDREVATIGGLLVIAATGGAVLLLTAEGTVIGVGVTAAETSQGGAQVINLSTRLRQAQQAQEVIRRASGF